MRAPSNAEEYAEAIEALWAYDSGSKDSGIHDPQLKQQCADWLQTIDTKTMTTMFRNWYFTDEAIEQGYGIEDAMGMVKWMADELDCDIT